MHSLIPFFHILCSILFYTFGMFDGQITVTVAKIGGQHIKYTCLIYIVSLTYDWCKWNSETQLIFTSMWYDISYNDM